MVFLFIGLGNPGASYINHRHNIGFKAIEALAEVNVFKKQGQAEIAEIKLKDSKIILCKPQTYMNLSGHAVSAIVQFYRIALDNVWVIHDDIDLPVGHIKTKKGGGNAGHNGLKSIDSAIGKEYHRIRIGVGRPEHKEDVAHYVLSNFSKEEKVIMDEAVVDVVRLCLKHVSS